VETGSGQFGYVGALATPSFDVPAEEDVENGVTYGDAAEFTGTLVGGGGVSFIHTRRNTLIGR
jgi:hypothetical protein